MASSDNNASRTLSTGDSPVHQDTDSVMYNNEVAERVRKYIDPRLNDPDEPQNSETFRTGSVDGEAGDRGDSDTTPSQGQTYVQEHGNSGQTSLMGSIGGEAGDCARGRNSTALSVNYLTYSLYLDKGNHGDNQTSRTESVDGEAGDRGDSDTTPSQGQTYVQEHGNGQVRLPISECGNRDGSLSVRAIDVDSNTPFQSFDWENTGDKPKQKSQSLVSLKKHHAGPSLSSVKPGSTRKKEKANQDDPVLSPRSPPLDEYSPYDRIFAGDGENSAPVLPEGVKRGNRKDMADLIQKLKRTSKPETVHGGKIFDENLIIKQGYYKEGKHYEKVKPLDNRDVPCAAVFHMRDKTSKVDFVCKQVSRENFGEAIKEAVILCRVNHPNVRAILGLVWNEHYFCLLLEYHADVKPLDEITDVTWERARAWIEQLLGALKYLHGEEIFHNDIHGGNILVSRSDHIYLIDFGLGSTEPKDGPKKDVDDVIRLIVRIIRIIKNCQGPIKASLQSLSDSIENCNFLETVEKYINKLPPDLL